MANTGCVDDAKPVAEHFLRTFADYPYIVCPSGSCTAMIRQHYEGILPPSPRLQAVTTKTYELCEFLVDVLEVDGVAGRFPYRVGLHNSCHGLRELRLGSCTERVMPAFNKARQLLETLQDITFVELDRQDECCGFGGTFAVGEVDVSVTMGKDRLADHQRHGAEIVTATDMSCLMHLNGLATNQGRQIPHKHAIQVLRDTLPATTPTPA